MVIRNVLIITLLCTTVHVWSAVDASKEYANDLPEEIVQALKAGDAKTISKYFNSSIELNFSDSQGVYGKAQAEQILKNFFSNNAPANGKFEYNHLHTFDNKDNAQYYIGALHTGKGIYRLHIFMKDQRIHQMRIDSND